MTLTTTQAPPAYNVSQEYDIKRRRRLAEQLMKAGEQPQSTEMVSGIAVRQSPWAALAKALTQGVAGYQSGQADAAEVSMNKDRQGRLAEAINSGKLDSLANGSPEEQMMALKQKMELDQIGAKGQAETAKKAAENQITFGSPNNQMVYGQNTTEPLSVRNNNPGNLKDMQTGEFRKFQDPASGLAAMQSDLQAKISGNSNAMKSKLGNGYSPSVANIISVYAPSSENDTSAYIAQVSKAMGVDPNAPLNPTDAQKLASAMIQQEGGQKATDYFGQQMPKPEDYMPTPANASAPQTSAQPELAYLNGKPLTENLKNGMAWARDPQTGQMVQVQIPNTTAKENFETTLTDLQNYLDQYAKAGGATSPKHSALSNAVDYIAATKGPEWADGFGGGQTFAKMFGTEQQALRDKIDTARSKAAAQYIDAAGLTSGQTNSVLEQERFLKSLGETSSPFESQQEAIANMSKAYGKGGIKPKKISDVEGGSSVKFLGFE